MHIDPTITILEKTIFKAARPLLRDFGEIYHLQQTPNSINKFSNKARVRSLNLIQESLQNTNLPMQDIMELKELPENGFVLFPLEGIQNFMHSFPFFAIGGIRFRNNKLTAALFYLPLQEECYSFSMEGMLCNRRKLQVANRTSAKDIFIGGNMGSRGTGSDLIDILFLASGRIDAFIAKTNNIYANIYDTFIKRCHGASYFTDDLYKASNISLLKKI